MSKAAGQADPAALRERLRMAWNYELLNHPFVSGALRNPYDFDEPTFDELVQPKLPEFDSADDRPARFSDRLFAVGAPELAA